MGITGRKPYTTRDVVAYGLPDPRLRPPDSLGELEKRAFLDLVCGNPAGQFRPGDLPLLCRFAELTVMAEQAAGELAAGGMLVDGKPSPWFAIHEKATRALGTLAMRLNIAPQVRVGAAPRTVASSLSYYDRILLEAPRNGEGDTTEPD